MIMTECFQCEKRIDRLFVWSRDHYLSSDCADYERERADYGNPIYEVRGTFMRDCEHAGSKNNQRIGAKTSCGV